MCVLRTSSFEYSIPPRYVIVRIIKVGVSIRIDLVPWRVGRPGAAPQGIPIPRVAKDERELCQPVAGRFVTFDMLVP